MGKFIFGLLTLTTSMAFAGATRTQYADQIQNTTGGTVLSVPSSGTALLSTTSSLPAANITGQVGVSQGGTGLSSGTSGGILGFTASGTVSSSPALTANALVIGGGAGATPSALGSTGTTTTLLHGNASGAPTFGAANLTTDVTGTLPVGNGGLGVANPTAGSVLVGNGSSAVSQIAAGTSGNVLTSNGTTWTSAAPASSSFVQNGTQASPQSVTASGGITLTGLMTFNQVFIAASTSGTVTVTKTPSITACTTAGQLLVIHGESATNLVLLQDVSALAGSGLHLNGNWTSGLNSTLTLQCDGNAFWNEIARQ